jgi:hypothetical protein
MNAKEARKISDAQHKTHATLALVEKLIVSEAGMGKYGTKVDIGRDILYVIRDHFKANGFNVDVQGDNGVYTLYLGW